MRRFDANIEIIPGERPLEEKDLSKLSDPDLRWRNQLRFALPELRVEKAGYVLLGREPDRRWKIDGRPGVLAGVSLGLSPGDTVHVGRGLTVTGTVSTGGEEDGEIVVPLRLAQEIAGKPGAVSRILVSAVVTPETEAYKLFEKKAKVFTGKELENMICTPFPGNVARDFGVALGADARVIRRVAETEGAVLKRIDRVVGLLALAAIAAACLSVLAAMTASVVDRRKEVGLLKALGATNGSVAALFLGEALLLAGAGSVAGYLIGLVSAKSMSAALFGSPVPGSGGVYLVTLATAVVIVALGVAWPLRRVVALQPRQVLHEV